MRIAFIVLLLAGCASPDTVSEPGDATYSVPVLTGHAINGADRIIEIVVSQAGEELGSGTYRTAGQSKDQFVTSLTVTASAGPLQIEAFDGGVSQAQHTIDASKCGQPDFQVHVVDDAVHLWSSCD